MRDNTKYRTLENAHIQKYQFWIREYELIKQKNHTRFKYVKDFYETLGICRQTFSKIYRRFVQNGRDLSSLLPKKRGPKYNTRRTPEEIEQLVLQVREQGCNKYEIHSILSVLLQDKTPSPSCIYDILKRYGKNRRTDKIKEQRRNIIRIMTKKAGEMAHIDTHHLSKDLIAFGSKRYFLVGVIDGHTRIGWTEVVEDTKSLSVMFATLHCFNQISKLYNIRFAEVLTDNGPEFGPRDSKQKNGHPFERLLIEMGVKHRYTKPYRPQTNGKIERFWRTINEDLIEGTYFESIEHFKKELFDYMVYYNQLRPHQALKGKTPELFNKSCQRIT